MRFAVDAHSIGQHLTGNEVFARSLLNALARESSGSEAIAYVSSDSAIDVLPDSIVVRSVSPNPYVRLGYDLSRQLRRDRPDLIHVQYTAPVRCPVPVVVSIHDVSYLEHPEYFTWHRRAQLLVTVRRTALSAAKVLTGSEFAKGTILKAYPALDEMGVVVTPYAPAPFFRVVSRESAAVAVHSEFGFMAPFILSVGDLQPRKNHIGLIASFAQMVRARADLKHHLVLTGKDTWFSPHIREAARLSGVSERIHFTGFVSDEKLLHLYNACELFVFPSFYEGFGLPALEAMACGRAVVTSRVSALPEVVDGAAILVDPYSSEQLARAMTDMLVDPELRSRFERLGIRRAAQFKWQDTARGTLDVYRSVCSGPASPAQRNALVRPARG
jgi:glycosyltransferase involved in cell wall biosynthesis